MKGIACLAMVAAVGMASAQVGDYAAVDGGYWIQMSLKPKGVWTFQTQYLNKPNKKGGGKWTKKGRQIQCVVIVKGKPVRGPEGSGTLTIGADGKTLTQRMGKRTITFKKLR
ncbi:MAG: hypothetical protein ACO1SV_11370 [Fimbriimonas sp.]